MKLTAKIIIMFQTRNLKYLIPIATSLEIPKGIPKATNSIFNQILISGHQK